MMDGSHWSCSKGYKCSSTELDTLTDVARDSGALGSRLTGAGWGGCTVSLIHQTEETEFLKKGRVRNYRDDFLESLGRVSIKKVGHQRSKCHS